MLRPTTKLDLDDLLLFHVDKVIAVRFASNSSKSPDKQSLSEFEYDLETLKLDLIVCQPYNLKILNKNVL